MTMTRQGEWFPASLLHKGDTYLDDGFTFRVVTTTRSADGWFVTIERDDGTAQRLFMSALLEVVELAP